MLKYIVFCLSEKCYGELTGYQEKMKEKVSRHLVRMYFLKEELTGPESDTEPVWFRDGECRQFAGEETLFITDSPQCFAALKQEGLYVIAFYHEGNREKSFAGARYGVEDAELLEYRSYEEAYRRLAGIPWDILETERLAVRESTVEDVEAFYEIYRDPSITYYMEALYPEHEAEQAYMKAYIEQIYGFYGFGLWTVILKETGRIIGRAGLSVREGYELPELGFVIGTEYQRKGYAREVCGAILDYAKKELSFEAVQALADERNAGSLHLLEGLGFVFERDVSGSDRHYKLFLKKL